MRIIKKGSIKPKEWLFACSKCGCEFAANERDRHDNSREGTWVVCPYCNKWISWSKGNTI